MLVMLAALTLAVSCTLGYGQLPRQSGLFVLRTRTRTCKSNPYQPSLHSSPFHWRRFHQISPFPLYAFPLQLNPWPYMPTASSLPLCGGRRDQQKETRPEEDKTIPELNLPGDATHPSCEASPVYKTHGTTFALLRTHKTSSCS